MTGVVSSFDDPAGLGVITAGDGTAYPFHCTEIADGTRTIAVGAAVHFDPLARLGRWEAGSIRPTSR